MTESQINWTLGGVATIVALSLGGVTHQFTLMVAVCSMAWAVIMFCNWIDAKEAKFKADRLAAKWESDYKFTSQQLNETAKLKDALAENYQISYRNHDADIQRFNQELSSMQEAITTKDSLIQTQSDTINDVVAIVDQYRVVKPRRIPWWKVAKAVGISEEGK